LTAGSRFPPGSRRATAIGIVALLVATGRQLAETGPLTLRKPPTVLSNGRPEPRGISPYLLFLADLRRVTTPGAVIAILPPGDDANLLIATGQLPRNRVIPPGDSATLAGRASFLAAYGRPVSPRVGRLASLLTNGFLYRISP
jgi:hypothetical protein